MDALEELNKLLESWGLTSHENKTNTPWKNKYGKIVVTVIDNDTRVWCARLDVKDVPEEFKNILKEHSYSKRNATYEINPETLNEFEEFLPWLIDYHEKKYLKTQQLYSKLGNSRFKGNKISKKKTKKKKGE